MRRYVQNHIRLSSSGRHSDTDVAVDGVAGCGSTSGGDAAANASPEAKRLHDDGALFIGGIKTFIIEEKVIIPISE